MVERTKYQQQIIRNYYKVQDQVALQRLGELVTNLYLAEGKARVRLWKNAASSLAKVGVPASRIEHLVAQDNPELLAKVLQELWGK